MKTKDELLKIYSAYSPYELELEVLKKGMYFPYPNHLSEGRRIVFNLDQMPFKIWCNPTNLNWLEILFRDTKPVLYSMDMLTKEELYNAGFEDHVDWLTHERETWIKKYGIEKFINETPYGHIQYLISKHYNIFGLDESEYIKKESVNNFPMSAI